MKRAKAEIITTHRGQFKYFLSILEKENDSGIFYNERLFFLLSGQHIGYMSDIKMGESPEQANFEKPKTTVLLTNIKSIVVNGNQLSIKFNLIDGNKKSERTWLLRMEKEELTRAWYDLLQRQRIGSTSSKALSPKRPDPPEEWKPSPTKVVSPEKKKELTISRHLDLSENAKAPPKKEKEKEFKEVGIGMSPRNAEEKKVVFKDPEQKLKDIMKESPPKVQQRPQPPTPSKPVQKIQEKQVQRSVLKQPTQKYPQKSFRDKPAEKSIDQTLQNTSRREPSEMEKSSQKGNLNGSDTKPLLVNTKYLNNEKSERTEKYRSKDYLERTHQLIKSFQHERTNRNNTSRLLLKEVEEEHSPSEKKTEHEVTVEKGQDWTELPWTYKYVKYGHKIFKEYEHYTQSLMRELVLDQSKRRDGAKYKPKLIKNGIHYYDIKDTEVKMAFIGLQDCQAVEEGLQAERVCNKKPVKMLQNEFNNFKALYEYLGTGQKLRVPLVTLCSYNGFVALFKATSKSIKKSIRFKEIQYELSQLERKSKIHSNFIQSATNIIIQLDEAHYEKYKQGENEASFNLFFIQEIEEFLLPDLITDSPNERLLLLRKELIDNYRIDAPPIKKELSFFRERQGYSKELESFSKSILVALSDAIVQMDAFRVYFLNSAEFSLFLHTKGVNIRYTGHLYSNLKALFQKRFVMTEMAARSCKALFRKTLQDLALGEEAPQGMELHCKICDFLNCVLGSTFETAAIWKVLSSHSRAYFGVQLNFDHIDRGHFLIALIQNLKLDVVWEKLRPQEAFKSNIFFTDKNLLGLNMHSKSYTPIFSNTYTNTVRMLEREQAYAGFQTLVKDLDLKNSGIPPQLSTIEPELKRYLSFFISPPASQEYPLLGLYQNCENGCPSKAKFELLLMRIKWALRQGDRQQYIRICDGFIRAASRHFGQFHPTFSELYELFSAYHLSNGECEDAITFAKSSLVNMLRVCGSTHQRTAQCYFHLSLCYIRGGRREQGATHIRKSLAILQSNNRTDTAPYALMQLKLALLLLSQGRPEECAQRVGSAKAVFQSRMGENASGFQGEITECLEMLDRCYELLQWRAESRELLAQCQARLRKTSNPRNLQKLLKVYLRPLLTSVSPEQASHYLDIISLLPVQPDQPNFEKAFSLLRARIGEDTLISSLGVYLSKLESIQQHIREKGLLRGWVNMSEVYQRQTVKDFLALTVELLTFLGEGFLSGALRQAL